MHVTEMFLDLAARPAASTVPGMHTRGLPGDVTALAAPALAVASCWH